MKKKLKKPVKKLVKKKVVKLIKVIKKCVICGKPFEAKKPWAKFCGDKCKSEFHRYATCPKCGHKFRRTGEYIDRPQQE